MSRRSEELVTDFEQKVRSTQRIRDKGQYDLSDDSELEWSRQRLVKYILELERQTGMI